MRGFNRTATMMCASLILESTLSGWTKGFACAEYRVQRFFWAPPATDGAFPFHFSPHAARRCPLWRRTGVMWYFWPDLAFDLVKGLVAGAASLALQAVAPTTLRALKRFRARWSTRKAA